MEEKTGCQEYLNEPAKIAVDVGSLSLSLTFIIPLLSRPNKQDLQGSLGVLRLELIDSGKWPFWTGYGFPPETIRYH